MWKWIIRIFALLCLTFLLSSLYIYLTLPDVNELRDKNPRTTAIIQQRIAEATEEGRKITVRQKWISFSAIPDLLKKVVRITEDAGFYSHEGVDMVELKEAFIKNWEEGKVVRGGSTITQQLAKNLYLSTSRSIFRKVKEYFIARRLENSLSKNRIFNLYLNVIEFGPGIFGIEAAAQYYYGTSVSQLDMAQMIRLVAVIPRPLSIKPTGQSRWLKWKCCWITEKLYLYHYIDELENLILRSEFC